MTEKEFWQMIEMTYQLCAGDVQEMVIELTIQLEIADEDKIKQFNNIYIHLLNLADTALLWDACFFIMCMRGEQNFINFRNWLIAQGETRFYQALEDPESLVDLVNSENRYDLGCE